MISQKLAAACQIRFVGDSNQISLALNFHVKLKCFCLVNLIVGLEDFIPVERYS